MISVLASLWWLLVGALASWLGWFLLDKYYQRDGMNAGAADVGHRAAELEARLADAQVEADTFHMELARTAGLLETAEAEVADLGERVAQLEHEVRRLRMHRAGGVAGSAAGDERRSVIAASAGGQPPPVDATAARAQAAARARARRAEAPSPAAPLPPPVRVLPGLKPVPASAAPDAPADAPESRVTPAVVAKN